MDEFSTDSFFLAQGGHSPTRADFIRRQSDRMMHQQLSQYALQTDPRAQMVSRLLQANLDPSGNQFGGSGAMLMLGSLMNSRWTSAMTGGNRAQLLSGVAAGLENMPRVRTDVGEFSGPGVMTNQLAIQSMRAIEDRMFTATGAPRSDRTHGLDRSELGRVMAMAGQRGLLSDIGEMATVQEFRTRGEIEEALTGARERAAQTGSSVDAGVVSDLEALEASLGESDEFDIPRRVISMSEDAKRRIGQVAEEGAKAIAAMKDMLGDLGDNALWSAMEDFTGGRIASRRALAEATERVETVQALAAVGGGSPEAYMAMHGQLMGFLGMHARTDSTSASLMADNVLTDVAMRRTGATDFRSVAQSMGLTISDDMEDQMIATLVKDASIIDSEFGDALKGAVLLELGNVDQKVQQEMLADFQQRMAEAGNDAGAQRRITEEFFSEAQRVSGITGRDAADLLSRIDDPRNVLTTATQQAMTETSLDIARRRELGQLTEVLQQSQFRAQGLSEEERQQRIDSVASFIERFGPEGLAQLAAEDGTLTVADSSAPGGSKVLSATEIANEMGVDFLLGDQSAVASLTQAMRAQGGDLMTLVTGSERRAIMAEDMERERWMQEASGSGRGYRAPTAKAFVEGLLGEQTITDQMAFDFLQLTDANVMSDAPMTEDGRPDFRRMTEMRRDEGARFFSVQDSDGNQVWKQVSADDIEKARETVGERVQEEFLQRIGFKEGVDEWNAKTDKDQADAIRAAVEGVQFAVKGAETGSAWNLRNPSAKKAAENRQKNDELFASAIKEMDMIATQTPEAAALVVKQVNSEIERLEQRNSEISGKRGRDYDVERNRNSQRIEELRDLSQRHGGAVGQEDMFAQIVSLLRDIATNTR